MRQDHCRRLAVLAAAPCLMLGLLGLLASAPHAGQRAGYGAKPPSPVLATIRFPSSLSIIQLAPDEATGHLVLVTQTTLPHKHTLDTLEVRDRTTGALLHATALGRDVEFGGAIPDRATGRLYALTGSAFDTEGLPTGRAVMTIIDAATGAVVRRVPVNMGTQPSSLDVDGGRALLFVLDEPAASADGKPAGDAQVRVLDLMTGRLMRTFRVANLDFGPQILVAPQAGSLFVPDVAGARVLDERTGATRGIIQSQPSDVPPSPYGAFPSALDERAGRVVISFLSENPKILDSGVYIVDARSGRLLHTIHPVGQTIVGVDERAGRLVAISNDTVGSEDVAPTPYSTLDTVDLGRGTLVRSVNIPPYPSRVEEDAAIDERTGHTIVATWTDNDLRAPNVVSVFDTRSGRLLRSGYTLGAGGLTLGVMAREGRVFALNAGGNIITVLDATRL